MLIASNLNVRVFELSKGYASVSKYHLECFLTPVDNEIKTDRPDHYNDSIFTISEQYMPYTTTSPKVQAWTPPKSDK